MNFLQFPYLAKIAAPIVRNNGTLTVGSVDCLGFNSARIYVELGLIDAAITSLKLQESDDNSTWVDIAGLDFSVSPNVLPASGDNGKTWLFDLPSLNGRKRYLKLVAIVANGSTGAAIAAYCLLGKPEQVPVDATGWGVAQAISL